MTDALPLLRIKGLARSFGGVQALTGVDMDVASGSITAVIGPNGAGKTTLFNLIAGVFPPTKGEIRIGARLLNGLSPEARVRLGISRTFQDVRLFANMTALENVMTGRHVQTRSGFFDAALRLPRCRKEEEDGYLQAMHFLNLVGLGGRAGERASAVPFGQQKLVAIARALACEPKLLLLDEPGAGLNALEKEALGELVQRIRSLGITVLLVEHDVNLVMTVADRVVVLDHGEKISEGTTREVQRDPRVISAYLGQETA